MRTGGLETKRLVKVSLCLVLNRPDRGVYEQKLYHPFPLYHFSMTGFP